MFRAILISIIVHLIILISFSAKKTTNKIMKKENIKSNLVFYRKNLDLKKEVLVKIERNEVKKNHLAENLKINKESNFVHEKKVQEKKENNLAIMKNLTEEILTTDKNSKRIVKEKEIKKQEVISKEDIPLNNMKISHKEIKVIDNKIIKNSFEHSKDFLRDVDGSFIAINSNIDGINLTFKENPQPVYPKNFRRVRLRRGLVIETSFIINTSGKVENIKLLNTNPKEFEEEVKKALELWSFEPIVYNGERIKVKVNKNFIFK